MFFSFMINSTMHYLCTNLIEIRDYRFLKVNRITILFNPFQHVLRNTDYVLAATISTLWHLK
jgi:hypothetical protein